MKNRITFTVLFLFVLISNNIYSQWSGDPAINTPICTLPLSEQGNPAITTDGNDGAIIAWHDTRNGGLNFGDIYAQSINSGGYIQWDLNGVSVCAEATSPQVDPAITSDGAGGAIITWIDMRNGGYYDVYAQRIDASGAPLWTLDGVPVCTFSSFAESASYNPAIISDGQGGAIITWWDLRNGVFDADIYAQRIDASGALLWALDGVPVCTITGSDQRYPKITSDGSSGAIITWYDERNGSGNSNPDVYAQRIDASGNLLWAVGGVDVCTQAGHQMDPQITSDGNDGAFITWWDDRNGNWDIYAQNINSSGAVVAPWVTDGLAVCTLTSNQQYPSIASDGSGGAIIAWYDERNGSGGGWSDIYAQGINSSGVALWATDGVPVSTRWTTQYLPFITSAGNGEAIIAWRDYSDNNDVYATKLFNTGPACTDFEDGTTNGWQVTNALSSIIMDGSNHYIEITTDQSGASAIFSESPPLTGNWNASLVDGCGTLCWDVNYLFAGDGNDGTTEPLTTTPNISIVGNGVSASFVTNNLITAGDGWHSYCAPLSLQNLDGSLPSNSDGHWVMSDGNNGMWDYLLSNVSRVEFSVDPTDYQNVKFGFDNICKTFKDCDPIIELGSVCDTLKAEVSGSAVADCCWSMSLTHPSNTTGITGIQFESLSPNSFVTGSSQLGSTYTSGWLYVENSTSKFTIKRLTGAIPSGQLNNFFNFCLNKLSNPQVVVVNWLNANDSIVCSDTVSVNCDIPCVSIIDAEVLCDNGNYALNYAFINNASFAINKIEVEQINIGGITVSPVLMTIPLVISGNASAVQSFTVSGAAPNTTVTIVFKFTSDDGCCSCTEAITFTTPSCMCEEIGASLEQDTVNCCATLSLTNNYSESYFTQVNLTALTTGTTFSTFNTNTTSGWYSLNTFASNTVQLVNIGTGFIPSGNLNGILNFCLTGFDTTPQQILVEWIRNDSVQCVDTIITTCSPTVITNECVQLVDDSLTCLPDGSFEYKFKVRNNSSHTTTGFQLNPVSPSMVAFTPVNFSSISIAPGMTSAEQTVTISGVNSNELFCFEIALYEHIYQNDKLQFSWCCHSDTVCIITPDCEGDPDCIEPPTGMVGWWPGDGHANDISGLNNHGTITRDVVYNTGKVDQSFMLNNYGLITVPNHPSLNFGTGNFTIDSWVKTTDSLRHFIIAQKGYGYLTYTGLYIIGYFLEISDGKLIFGMGDGINIIAGKDTTVKIADGEWHLVAVTVDRTSSTGGKLFVDGNVVLTFDPTTVPNSISNNEDLILFNKNFYYGQTSIHIDELEIFNRELSESEIKSIFNAGSEGKCKPTDELGSICGMKFNDLNGNGRRDDGEPGIPNWTITLSGALEISTTTDREGNFCFVNLPAGEYKIYELMQNGWVQTSPFTTYYSVNLAAGQNITGVYFGNKVKQDDKPGSICGMKFNDLNGNGRKDDNEPGLSNWTITLDGAVEMTVTTDRDGSFCFVDLPAGVYTIKEIIQEGWIQTSPSTGSHEINLAAGQNITGIYFGNKVEKDNNLGSICGMKFNDLNGNGRKDEGEPGLPDWTINLDGAVGISIRTDKEGNFCFTNLREGEYRISEGMQNGWVQTLPSTDFYGVNLAAGQNISGIDFGNRVDKDDKLGSICGMKFNDLNGNGRRDDGEPGLPDWRIYLDGAASMSTTTDREGNFCFTRLPEGEYRVSEGMLNSWVQTAPALGYFVVDLASGQNITEFNFGNKRRIEISNPKNKTVFKRTDRPTFEWFSPVPMPQEATSFQLKIVEIVGNQSPEEACRLNKAFFERDSIRELAIVTLHDSTGGTPPGDPLPAFNFGKRYAWQVRLNGANEIESEVWTFEIEEASVRVLLTQPPPNQLKFDDLWKASLENLTAENLDVYLNGSLSNSIQGNVFETKSELKTLKPGSTMISSDDFDTEKVLTIFDRWGILVYGSGDYTMCLNIEDQSGEILGSGCIVQKVDIQSSVSGPHQVDNIHLMQSYPNPFKNTATIEYYIPSTSFITISVYDIYGKEIEVLVNDEMSPGHYEVIFNGKNLTSGVYFYTLKTEGFIQSKKMILKM